MDNMVIGTAMAVKRHIVNVISMSLARGNRFTVTTEMMDTKNPREL